MNDEKICEGACACGAVRYRLEATPLVVHCCHCTWCQRETGAAFALNAMLEAANVTLLQGEPEPVATPSQSGKGQTIWRCPDCRVAVWSTYAGAGEKLRFMRVGTLDAGHDIKPDVHIYTSTKQSWVLLPDGVPQYAEYYPAREVWPPDSIARIRAVRMDDNAGTNSP